MSVLQLVFDSLALGSQYALVALGIGLIFGVMRMINFAQGDLIMFGAYALVVPAAAQTTTPLLAALPVPLLIVAVILFVAFAAWSTERIAFRPLRHKGSDSTTLLISTFTVGYFLQSLVLFIHTGRPKSVNIMPTLLRQVEIGPVRTAIVDLATIGVSFAFLALTLLVLRRSRIGLQMRAASEDFMMARLLGIKSDRVIAAAFALSGALAGAVTLMLVAKTGVLDFRMGVPLAIAGFVATVIGGMGSLLGAVLGGYFLGFAATLLQALLPADLRPARDAFLFGLVILVLLIRPQGLFAIRQPSERI